MTKNILSGSYSLSELNNRIRSGELTLPKMILFDYGHTLFYEPGFDGLRGTEAVMAHAVRNPRKLSAAMVNDFSNQLYMDIKTHVINNGIEIHNMKYQKLLYE